ncbi:ERG4/ERG24 ergosterol biosynthesis protein [Amylostereum chailletii]|nr:ERG4/ERG24 ergosterol biosynthesis protein [Amylostereum chailletii]
MSASSTAVSSGDLHQRNGKVNGKSEQNGATDKKLSVSDEGRRTDQLLDKHLDDDVGFPLLMYYLWICLWFYDGQLVYPTSVDNIKPFFYQMWTHVRDDASPNAWAWKVYSLFVVFELVIAGIIPGYQQEGLPVPSLNYKTLMYNCNALQCIYITLAVAGGLHYTGTFRLTQIMENYGHLMSVAMIYGFGVSFATYFWAVLRGEAMRMSGSFPYDLFMGAALNPRIGSIDLKMWAEVRVPWMILLLLSISGACKQYDEYGYVTPNMAFMVLATWFYLNACGKGEECIPQTWDMFHEKWGFMVIFWNFAGVPFTYLNSVVYMASHDPSKYRFSTPTYVLLYATLITMYYIWDTAMSQKSHFKRQLAGSYKERWTFPQLPWRMIKDPQFVQTAHGNRLLVSGWWAYSRKPNYAADWTMSFCWGAVVGTASPIPYFYCLFFLAVLTHRCGRDFERCAVKYGKDWERYCEIVRWKFVPGIY